MLLTDLTVEEFVRVIFVVTLMTSIGAHLVFACMRGSYNLAEKIGDYIESKIKKKRGRVHD